MKKVILLAVVVVLLLLLAFQPQFGCNSSGGKLAESGLRIVHMTIGSRDFTLEVADTESTRRKGLMFRESMPSNCGMLFVFAHQEPLEFYMKNTRIPLDIIYLDAEGRVVSISAMKPFDETIVSSGQPARYAIELNQGTAAKVRVKVGDRLEVPAEARQAKE